MISPRARTAGFWATSEAEHAPHPSERTSKARTRAAWLVAKADGGVLIASEFLQLLCTSVCLVLLPEPFQALLVGFRGSSGRASSSGYHVATRLSAVHSNPRLHRS